MNTVQSKSAILLYPKSIAGKLHICVVYNIWGPGTPSRKTVFFTMRLKLLMVVIHIYYLILSKNWIFLVLCDRRKANGYSVFC